MSTARPVPPPLRRMAQRLARSRDHEALRWTLLVSVWAHAAALVGLHLLGPLLHRSPPLRVVELALLPSSAELPPRPEQAAPTRRPSRAAVPVEAAPLPEPPRQLRYVRVDEAAHERPPERTDRIAARDSWSDADRRAPVQADVPGRVRPHPAGASRDEGERSVALHDARTVRARSDASLLDPEDGDRTALWTPGTSDPVDDLREALGWGPIDREALAPRPSELGVQGLEGAAGSSPQASADVAIAWETALDARGTPLGVYIAGAEQVVAERWRRLDLSPHARASGLGGQVTVRYRIHSNGKVTDVHVQRSSGNPELDEMAVQAVPERLPKFPKDLQHPAIHHQVVLRYRNPLTTFRRGGAADG